MWLVALLAVGCGPSSMRTTGPGADSGAETSTPTPTETGTASTCPWIGQWTIADARCSTAIYDDVLGRTATIEAVEGEPDSCGLVLDASYDDETCVQYIQFDNPRANAQLWEGWSLWCWGDGTPQDIGSVTVSTDGAGVLFEFETSIYPGCPQESSVELTPPI